MRLTPYLLLNAYAHGIFPMAENRRAEEVFWVDPEHRGIIPLDEFHVPRKLRRAVRRGDFDVTCDAAFPEVMQACAAPSKGREDSWINREILRAYTELHGLGAAHSVECWQDGALVGGLYGVSIARAFFGESMFSRVTDASKVALVHLMARLTLGGFTLCDAQFYTSHLGQFGAKEISREAYHALLREALAGAAEFPAELSAVQLDAYLQSLTQIS